jgi:hypothetical protein
MNRTKGEVSTIVNRKYTFAALFPKNIVSQRTSEEGLIPNLRGSHIFRASVSENGGPVTFTEYILSLICLCTYVLYRSCMHVITYGVCI